MDVARRFRGVIRTSLTAGIALSAVATSALAIGLATGLVPSSVFGGRELIAVALRGLAVGAVAGGLFSWFAARGTHGQSLSALSTRRVAVWGGTATAGVFLLAGLAVPGIVPLGVLASSVVVAGLGGSIVSMGMLRLARRSSQSTKALDRSGERFLP